MPAPYLFNRPTTLTAIFLFIVVHSANGQIFELGDPPVVGQFTAYGAAVGGSGAGLPVATGDFNGDGFLDLVQTPMLADVFDGTSTRTDAGLAYVTFGDGNISGFVDFATPPANSAIFLGAKALDITGDEVWAGDVNNDTIDDILLCAQGTDGPDGTRSVAGSVYIIFGHMGLSGVFDLKTPPPFVTQVHGAEAEDRLGIWIRTGDLNGDTIDDILVGADGADGPPGPRRPNTGSAYIIFGTETWSASMDLALPYPGRTVLFHGTGSNDRFGSTLNIADIDGDGQQDVLISAALNRAGAGAGGPGNPSSGGGDGPPGLTRTNAGESYVFFNPGVWPDVIDSVTPPLSVAMTVVYGESGGDFTGEEVLGADLNQDGSDELIMGGLTASPLGRTNAGTGYILEGGSHLRNREIDLASPPGDIRITRMFGAATGDISGDTMIGGDVDNDGFEDLMNGSPNHDGPRGGNQGRMDVLFGNADLFPASIDLASIPANVRHVTVYGPSGGDILCYSMAIGDWDQDGFMDPMPNGMAADGFNNAFNTAGDAYVISGAALSGQAPPFTPTETPIATETPTPTATPTFTRSADFNSSGEVDAEDLLILIDNLTTE